MDCPSCMSTYVAVVCGLTLDVNNCLVFLKFDRLKGARRLDPKTQHDRETLKSKYEVSESIVLLIVRPPASMNNWLLA